MIAALYGLKQIPVHFPDDIPWNELPRRCIVQIHWNPEPEFTALLDRAGFRVIAIGRHLLDILMSYLNYVYYVHQEGICPGGGACGECVLVGRTPQSREFRDYVASDRAALLFGYTPRWWNRPGIIQFRYEELVADAATQLRNLAERLGESPTGNIEEVIEATSIGKMKPNHEVWQYHFWQGRPGLWRSMIPSDEAVWLAEQRREYFEILGYSVDPDPSLKPFQADLNWLQLQLNSTREYLGLERTKHRALIAATNELRHQFRLAQKLSAEQETLYAETHAELLRYRDAFLDTRGQLLGKERELEATTQRLDATYQAGESTYQELEAARHELQTIRAELQVTSGSLDQTRQRLDEARQRQLPLDELGSRGVKWALRALRLYRRAKSALPSFARAAKSSSPAPPPQFSRLARRRSQSERVEH
jgi:hypothetical protein